MLAVVELEYRRGAFEVMTSHQARGLELRQHAIDRREANVFVGFEQMLIDVFRAHVPGLRGPENFENLDTRQRDLEPGLAQVIGFHVLLLTSLRIIRPHYLAGTSLAPLQ